MADPHYIDVYEEIKRGIPPDVLCATCPWDRLCIQPPMVSVDDAIKTMRDAHAKDLADEDDRSRGSRTLLALVTAGTALDSAKVCPVLAIKLRSPDGRVVNDLIRRTMRSE